MYRFRHDRTAKLERKVRRLAADITNLNNAVTTLAGTVDSVVAALQTAGKPDQAEVDSLTEHVTAATTALQNAVTPPAPVEPAPEPPVA